jgi:predicted ATPase with chaperone activity
MRQPVGVEALEVEIEVHVGRGNRDKITIVGLPDTAVKESKGVLSIALKAKRWCRQTLIVALVNSP